MVTTMLIAGDADLVRTMDKLVGGAMTTEIDKAKAKSESLTTLHSPNNADSSLGTAAPSFHRGLEEVPSETSYDESRVLGRRRFRSKRPQRRLVAQRPRKVGGRWPALWALVRRRRNDQPV